MTPVCRSWPWWRWAISGLSTLGLVLSAYLGWHYLAGGSLIGCSGGSPCDEVLGSRWSAIGGVVPVSGLAAGVYLAILVASFFIGSNTETAVRQLAWRAMLVLVGAAAGSAVWFTVVQKWMIGAFCPYCMATHVTGLLLATLMIWRAARESTNDSATVANVPAFANRRAVGAWPAIGLAFAGILAGSQVAFTPSSLGRGGDSREANATALDPRTVPLVGSPDATRIVKVLFDYQCRHCQQLHVMLDEAVRRYGGKLAFALCPAPLSPQCNPHVTGDGEAFKDSCELARIALTVWVARRGAFSEFDHWMFSAEPGRLWRPRTLEAAKAKAIELVGSEKFDAARADPWIERHLQTSIRIYGDNGANAVPKLVYGPRWITPQPRDAGDFILILENLLTAPKP
jgi:uncharacterized membrane protein